MVMEAENTDTEESRSGFPEVPDEAIVKPEEELLGDENKHDDEGIDDSTDMDGDGSPD
ncbi:hypothetical protein BH18THE2_BH18THE2_35510 [soil metagenome]